MHDRYGISAVRANMTSICCYWGLFDLLACCSTRNMQVIYELLSTSAFTKNQIWLNGLHAAPQQQLLSAMLGNQIVQSCADEIDAIAPKRETAQREMERRIVAQMLTCMDDLSAPPPSAQQEPPVDATAAATEPQAAADVHQDQLPSKHVVIIGMYYQHHLPCRF